jgi:hypothetical protein
MKIFYGLMILAFFATIQTASGRTGTNTCMSGAANKQQSDCDKYCRKMGKGKFAELATVPGYGGNIPDKDIKNCIKLYKKTAFMCECTK